MRGASVEGRGIDLERKGRVSIEENKEWHTNGHTRLAVSPLNNKWEAIYPNELWCVNNP